MKNNKKTIVAFLVCVFLVFSSQSYSQEDSSAEDVNIEASSQETVAEPEQKEINSEDLVKEGWGASATRNKEKLDEIVAQCKDLFEAKAKALQAQLTAFPSRDRVSEYQVLNDFGTCLFIDAEYAMNSGLKDEAIEKFQNVIDNFSWAQSWDPSRGNYWSVAEKSQASIDILTGKAQEEMDKQRVKVIRTKPYVHTKGKVNIVDYTKYGEFKNVGKSNYHYSMKNPKALAKAVGEGIYPNTGDIYNNPRYKQVKKEGRLIGSHWDFVNTDDLEAAYFKWFTASEPWGVRMFYIGLIFERAGMYYEALRAYHSLVVHFPKTVGYTYWQTPWYPASAAIAKIKHILKIHPELNLDDKWMKIEVVNGFDNDVKNDEIITYPGKIVKKSWVDLAKERFNLGKKVPLNHIKQKVGHGKVRLVQYTSGHWQLLVDDKPFLIKGVTYEPTMVGQSPDKGTLANWMTEDTNDNGLADGPFDAWVDKNKNNQQDSDEPNVGDFQLLKEMGANVIRLYHVPHTPDKEVLRRLYNEYGIRVILGDFLGKYAIGSGATWAEGTDYENEEHKKNMLEAVKKMVLEHKDEPYILLWLLGNENNYGVASNADKKPEAFFKFVNEAALLIKSLDPDHPVAVSNGDALFLDVFAEHAPDVDIFTANAYRGDYGFGSFWEQVAQASGKPAFITEYGSPAYAPHLTLEEGEQAQADYHYGNWLDIYDNSAGQPEGVGNSLGGVLFEWLDEWWKNYDPYLHDRKSDAIGPFAGGYYFEEWFGIISQGKGQNSPFLRQPRKAYYLYQELWNK